MAIAFGEFCDRGGGIVSFHAITDNNHTAAVRHEFLNERHLYSQGIGEGRPSCFVGAEQFVAESFSLRVKGYDGAVRVNVILNSVEHVHEASDRACWCAVRGCECLRHGMVCAVCEAVSVSNKKRLNVNHPVRYMMSEL